MIWKHFSMFKLDFLKIRELSWPKFVESPVWRKFNGLPLFLDSWCLIVVYRLDRQFSKSAIVLFLPYKQWIFSVQRRDWGNQNLSTSRTPMPCELSSPNLDFIYILAFFPYYCFEPHKPTSRTPYKLMFLSCSSTPAKWLRMRRVWKTDSVKGKLFKVDLQFK